MQAIELYVNADKTAAGTSVNTYANAGVKANQNNMGKTYSSTTVSKKTLSSLDNVSAGTATDGWDYFVLRMNPYDNDGSGSNNTAMLGFMEVSKVEETTIGGQVSSPPEKIIVTDIATRAATADGKTITLNESALEDPSIFPQKAKVTWANGTGKGYDSIGSTTPGDTNYLGGTTIIWDASTIDFSAAELTSSGEYLAGYIYGYVLNKVMYAIPVYTTTAYALTNVYAYTQSGSTFNQSAISIDINADSDKYNPSMPDLVRIKFQNGKVYTFGTVLTDVNGDMVYARAKGNAVLGKDVNDNQKVNIHGNKYKIEYAYTAGLKYSTATASDVASFNAGQLTMGLYTKLADRYVAVAVGSAVEGGTYYKVVTETVEGVEYAVLDYSKLPTGKNFPVGWIAYDEYEFGWEGGAVDVNFEYQWGFSAVAESSVTVSVKGYEIDPKKIANFSTTTSANATDADKRTNFTSFDAYEDLDSILADASFNNSIAEYIKTFVYVNGKYTSGQYQDLSVSWDLTNLEKRLEEIKVVGADGSVSYDYYKGIDVTVTALVGANVFRYVTGYDDDGDPIYGFVGDGNKNTNNGAIAQKVQVPVKIAGRVFNSLETESLTFDTYSSDVINGDSFATNVKAIFEGTDKPVVLDSSSLTITAPYVKVDGEYSLIAEGVTREQFSYLGYEGQDLYAKLDIGTEKSGKQTIYVPINVTAMTANVYRLTVNREHTLDPEWYNLADEYNVLTINFKEKGTPDHTMKPDWSTVKYYSNATYTKEVDNIFKGGTFYATVEANPCDADGNLLVDANGVPYGAHNGQSQVIKLRLTVPQKDITSIKFLANTDSVDMITSGAINTVSQATLENIDNYTANGYAEYVLDGKTYNLSTYHYVVNSENYFRVGEWGDYRNGTAVAITYTTEGKQYTEIAFVRDWNLAGFTVNSVGGDRYAIATVGAQEFRVKLATPSLAITEMTLEGESSVKFFGGTTTLTALNFANEVPSFEYNVFKAWQLPTTVAVKGEQVAGTMTNVKMNWINASTPGSLETDFIEEDGKKVYRTDENGAYVLREVKFYNEGSVVYPAKGAFEVKIYLVGDNGETIIAGAENVDTLLTAPTGLNLIYNVFGVFTLPTTADVVYNDGTPNKEGVPVVWSAGAPTTDEIKAGTFTRTAHIGANIMSAEYTFSVAYAYEVEGLGTAGDLAYTLTADKFYNGLPTSATIYPDKESKSVSYQASLNWKVKYDTNGNITSGLNEDGTVNVEISANGVKLEAKVMLAVSATKIA